MKNNIESRFTIIWLFLRLLKGENSISTPFSTSRDSKSTALKWRSSLSLSEALTVQQYCNEEMQKLGYLLVDENLSENTEVLADLPYNNK